MNAMIHNLQHIDLCIEGIVTQNWQLQHDNNSLSQQVAYCRYWQRGQSLTKIHWICHHCVWHLQIPNPSPHYEAYWLNLVSQILGSNQTQSWRLITRDLFIFWSVNSTDIQEPDKLILPIMLKFIVDCIQSSAQSWTAIIGIQNASTIFCLDLNLPYTSVWIIPILNIKSSLVSAKMVLAIAIGLPVMELLYM